jgi:hypothetical protein
MRSIMVLIDLTALLPDYIHRIIVAIDPTLANSSSTKIITILKITRILSVTGYISPYPAVVMVIRAHQKLYGILVNVFRSSV